MRKILWLVLLFATYVWVMGSGNEHLIVKQGKYLYEMLVSWFDDAEVDFQVKSSSPQKVKKKPRRWD